jgi:hypothetical protein
VDTLDHARGLFLHHHARYEVSPYFVVLDVRPPGVRPSRRKIQAGYDVDLYGNGFDHGAAHSFENGEPEKTLEELHAACQIAVGQAVEHSGIEIIDDDGSVFLDVKSHLEPEAMVRIRITHTRGLDQAAGESERKVLAGVVKSLESLGVKKLLSGV